MELRVLAILDDNRDAVKLVATWPVAGRRADVVIDEREVKIPENDIEYWAAVSGVDPDDIMRLLPQLFSTEICGPQGHVDPHASTYLTNVIKARLPRAQRS